MRYHRRAISMITKMRHDRDILKNEMDTMRNTMRNDAKKLGNDGLQLLMKKEFLFNCLTERLNEFDKLYDYLSRENNEQQYIEFHDGDYDDTNLYIIELLGYIVHRPFKQVTVGEWEPTVGRCSAVTCGYGCRCQERREENERREEAVTHIIDIPGRILIP